MIGGYQNDTIGAIALKRAPGISDLISTIGSEYCLRTVCSREIMLAKALTANASPPLRGHNHCSAPRRYGAKRQVLPTWFLSCPLDVLILPPACSCWVASVFNVFFFMCIMCQMVVLCAVLHYKIMLFIASRSILLVQLQSVGVLPLNRYLFVA